MGNRGWVKGMRDDSQPPGPGILMCVGMLLALAAPGSAQIKLPGLPTTAATPASQANPATASPAAIAKQLQQLQGSSTKKISTKGPRITSRPMPAAPLPPGSTDIGGVVQIPGVTGGSVPWSVIVTLTALTLIPSILMCMTPFARLLIVFHFLRQALGLQTTPSNQTLIGLSLILTFFLMQPVANQVYQQAVIPMESGQISAIDAVAKAGDPMRQFMSHYVRDKDVAMFVDLAHEPRPATMNDVSMRVLLPAYILGELKAGFQIGTVLFLPFLIVDMVVASITTSVGMLQLPPVVISTPLKLLLFLMVDGWHLLVGSLMRSFN